MRRLLLSIIVFSTIAMADDRVLVRTQWRTSNINEPNITYFKHLENQRLHIAGGINFNEKNISKNYGTGECVNFLSRLVQYPLQKMLDNKSLTQEQYDFYKKFGANIDPQQVVYFNSAVPKIQRLEVRHISMNPKDPFGLEKQLSGTIMENLVALNDETLSNEEFLKETSKMLEAQSSMWLVRGHTIEANGTIAKKTMPWQLEKDFSSIKKESPKGLNFELGRASTETHEDLQMVLNASVLTAANDVISAEKDLSESYLFAHAISNVHTRLYTKYGFELIKKNEAGESLMVANLESIYKKINPLNEYHESAPFLEYFDHDPVKALKFRNKMRYSYSQFVEQEAAHTSEPLLVDYHDDWHSFMRDDFHKMEEKHIKNFIYNPGSTSDIFANRKVPEYFLKSRTPGNHIFGLDAKALEKDPNYLGKTIGGMYLHYVNEINKTSAPQAFGQNLIHESAMVFYVEDKSFVEAAKKLGAEVKEVSATKRSKKFSENAVSKIEHKGYELNFSAMTVKMISAHYFNFSKIPELKTGVTNLQLKMMSGL